MKVESHNTDSKSTHTHIRTQVLVRLWHWREQVVKAFCLELGQCETTSTQCFAEVILDTSHPVSKKGSFSRIQQFLFGDPIAKLFSCLGSLESLAKEPDLTSDLTTLKEAIETFTSQVKARFWDWYFWGNLKTIRLLFEFDINWQFQFYMARITGVALFWNIGSCLFSYWPGRRCLLWLQRKRNGRTNRHRSKLNKDWWCAEFAWICGILWLIHWLEIMDRTCKQRLKERQLREGWSCQLFSIVVLDLNIDQKYSHI